MLISVCTCLDKFLQFLVSSYFLNPYLLLNILLNLCDKKGDFKKKHIRAYSISLIPLKVHFKQIQKNSKTAFQSKLQDYDPSKSLYLITQCQVCC